MEKISWNDHVKNEVLQRVKEERNILNTKNEGSRNGFVTHCLLLLKHFTAGKIERKRRRGRRHKQVLDYLNP